MEHFFDFDSQQWSKDLLASDIELIESPDRRPVGPMRKITSNSLVSSSLHTDRTIRAWRYFKRPHRRTPTESVRPEAQSDYEYCLLLSLGDGLDGMIGRAHGGFNALVIDHITGSCAERAVATEIPPATASLKADYKAPIKTPGLVLARAWLDRVEGRKVWVQARIEDGRGGVFATGEVLYIIARPGKL